MRDCRTVIKEMLNVIPKEQPNFKKSLKYVYRNAFYKAPEDNSSWLKAHDIIIQGIPKPVEDWEFEVLSIFTTKSIDELKQLVNETTN